LKRTSPTRKKINLAPEKKKVGKNPKIDNGESRGPKATIECHKVRRVAEQRA